jgi:hypothetical protein
MKTQAASVVTPAERPAAASFTAVPRSLALFAGFRKVTPPA